MEIKTQQAGGFLEVSAAGRLDAYWADHLSQALEEIIRAGDDRIRVNMRDVEYISSMGIRVLVTFYKKLIAINGAFVVVSPSEPVAKVLEMVGLRSTLMSEPEAEAAAISPVSVVERGGAQMEVFALPGAPASMKIRAMGDPELLESAGFGPEHCRTAAFPDSTFGLGLGAFGADFEECATRFGEFFAISGAAAYQPSDTSNAPDYLLAQGSYVPELQVLYALQGEGRFSMLGRFDVDDDTRAVTLSTLADMALEASGASQIAMVVVGESAGLVGASLRRAPVKSHGNGASMFRHPEIRQWLSFTTDRAFSRTLAVAVGVVARTPSGMLDTFLRPLNATAAIHGHVHAAAFPYRPLQRGQIDLKTTIRALFEQESILGLLHLVGDDRGASGVAESEFVRGACWFAPIDTSAI